ncbi:MAG: hypothetical protein JSS59_07415 [Proteobacteria bacterium]|nr:hypothetical protein [Pseudomonadota bacterium]
MKKKAFNADQSGSTQINADKAFLGFCSIRFLAKKNLLLSALVALSFARVGERT